MKDNITTLIFDVNETLLDLDPLKKSIDAALGNGAAEVWFSQLLQYSLVESITGSYHNFSEIASAVLKINAQKKNFNFTDAELQEILIPINKLNAYPDVSSGLDRLKDSGFKMVAFSNGKPSVLKEQLDFANLTKYFDHILSVDSVQKYKPHPETYKYALAETNSVAESSMMVAAHGWDIAGAQRARLKTAFIKREGKFLFPLAGKPDFEVPDISGLARELIG